MALGIDPGIYSGPESRRPVTAQERQREREEKRRKKQERAREKEKKMKEKEKKEGKEGDFLGGVLLSDNDKSLLQRWTKMIDSCSEKSQPVNKNNDGANKQDLDVNLHRGAAVGDRALNNATDKDATKIQPREQVIPQQPSLPFSMSQNKPPADMVVALSGGIDMTVSSGLVKNDTLKRHTKGCIQSGFSCVANWSGARLETRPPQQPNMASQPPSSSSFLQPQIQTNDQPQYDSKPQPQLLPLESFLSKTAPLSSRETNGIVDVRVQNNINSLTAASGPMEKLCPSVEEKPTQNIHHLCGTLGAPSQPHPSLGFTDTGQQGPSIALDINKVTQQLSKSQVYIYIFIHVLCVQNWKVTILFLTLT